MSIIPFLSSPLFSSPPHFFISSILIFSHLTFPTPIQNIVNVQISYAYRQEASLLKKSILRQLWDPADKFYKVITYVTPVQVAKGMVSKFVSVRELHGFTPWYVRCSTCCTCCAVQLCAVRGIHLCPLHLTPLPSPPFPSS